MAQTPPALSASRPSGAPYLSWQGGEARGRCPCRQVGGLTLPPQVSASLLAGPVGLGLGTAEGMWLTSIQWTFSKLSFLHPHVPLQQERMMPMRTIFAFLLKTWIEE